MFDKPSMITRIAVGKIVGLVIGVIGFVTLPYVAPDMPPMFKWGVLFWYATVGAMIGLIGIYTRHPILALPMPWWFRAPLIGAWMNFVLTLFAYDAFADFLVQMMGPDTWMRSPFWFVVEGALVGLLIGYAATKLGGEGKETVEG